MAVIDCPSPTAGAGDVVAAALPNLKCLRKVTLYNMNPVPVLQTVAYSVDVDVCSHSVPAFTVAGNTPV